MATILTKKSDTASSVPLAADLTNAAGGAELAVNTADKRLFAKTSGGTVVEVGTNPSALTLPSSTSQPSGSANGVAYLNGSKVLTSGSALTFDGTLLQNSQSSAASGTLLNLANTTTGAFMQFSMPGVANVRFGSPNTDAFVWQTFGSGAYPEQMRLDASGNLGLGVTPSAWSVGKAFEVGALGNALWGPSAADVRVMQNAYYSDAERYASSNAASMYRQTSGVHQWFTAPSGTAGNAISFTQAMTLDASGNLLVGKTSTSPTTRGVYFEGGGVGAFNSAQPDGGSSAVFRATSTGNQIGSIVHTATSTSYSTSSDYRLKENIQPMTGALDRISALKPVTYTWKADGSAGEGFIAHELAEVCPAAVTGKKDGMRVEQYEISPAVPATFDDEGNELTPAIEAVMGEREVPDYQGIDVSFLVGTLTAAIQELKAEFDAYKAAHP